MIENVLIVEDELPASRQLVKMIKQELPQVNILATLDSVEDSVHWLRNNTAPDLIFMDIQIADGLSFDIFRQVEIASPLIFTTAFDHYAVQAFKVNAIDYLLKPVDPDDLKNALQKVQDRAKTESSPKIDLQMISQFFQKTTYKERFLIKTGQHFSFLQTSDAAFFRSSEGLTQAFTYTGKKHFVEHTIEELGQLLDPKDFFRINRGLILHINAIQKIHPHLNGRLKLDLQPAAPEEIFVSRDRVNEFKAWLGG
jgi:DNA-binding LytR/AlgR family response regulator